MRWTGLLVNGVIKLFTRKGELKNERLKMLLAAIKGRITPRAAGGWFCIITVLSFIGWDIMMNGSQNLDSLFALLIVALSV